jgi:hypothetical protein
VSLALLLLLTLPLHLWLQQRPGGILANILAVLLRRKTWVGYAGAAQQLPPLRPGVLTSTSLPPSLNELPPASLQVSDEWYATGFTAYADLKKIARGFRYLGHRR